MILLSNIMAAVCAVSIIWVFIHGILIINKFKRVLEHFKCSNTIAEKENKYLKNVVQRQAILIEMYEVQIRCRKIEVDTVPRCQKAAAELADRMGYKND